MRTEIADRRAQAEAAARDEREEAARRQAEEQRQREEEARQAEAEQRAARAARAAALADTSRELASAGQYPQALATLTEATRLDPGNGVLQDLTRQIRDAKTAHETAEKRARDLAAKLAEAESRLAAGDLAKARKSADAAAQIDAPAVAAILGRIADAEARAAQEKIEQQKAAEAARLARERDQKVTALLAKAKKAKKPADALGFLEDALRLDPQRPELPALIAQRQAEIALRATPPSPPVPDRAASPAVGVPARKTSRPLSPALLGGAAVVVLLLMVGLWYALRDPDPKPAGGGVTVVDPKRPDPDKRNDPPVVTPSSVTIVTEPWANVTLTPAAGGDATTCTTPCRAPAGARRLPDGLRERRAVAAPHRAALRPCRPARRGAPEDARLRRRSRRGQHRRPLAGGRRAGVRCPPAHTIHAAARLCRAGRTLFVILPRDVSSMGAPRRPVYWSVMSGPMGSGC